MRRPTWFEPVRGFGEWVGFLCGLFVAAGLIALVGWIAIDGDFSSKELNEPDAFGIHFKNDLGASVVLGLCHSDHSARCEHPYYRDHIDAGRSFAENIAPDIRTEWAIESPNGALLRCVVLYWKYYPGSDRYLRLSSAPRWSDPCRRATPTIREHS